MIEFNKVILIGKLLEDPGLQETRHGQPFTKFQINNRREFYTPPPGGIGAPIFHEEESVIDCLMYGNPAKSLYTNTRRGDTVLIEGRLAKDQDLCYVFSTQYQLIAEREEDKDADSLAD